MWTFLLFSIQLLEYHTTSREKHLLVRYARHSITRLIDKTSWLKEMIVEVHSLLIIKQQCVGILLHAMDTLKECIDF